MALVRLWRAWPTARGWVPPGEEIELAAEEAEALASCGLGERVAPTLELALARPASERALAPRQRAGPSPDPPRRRRRRSRARRER